MNLPLPNPGDRISANLIREIIRAIRSLTPIAGHGVKVKRGPNGTVYDAAVQDGKTERSKDLGCYFIVLKEVTESDASDSDSASGSTSTLSLTFGNPYYRCGGKTYEGEDEIEGVTLPAIVALKVTITGNTPSTELASYSSLATLQSAEQDENHYLLPLYKFNSYGNVECDFRNAPNAAMWEFANQS